MSKQRLWRRFGLTVVAAGATILLLAGCGADNSDSYGPDGTKRGPVAVDSYEIDGWTVTLAVMSCSGSPEVEVTQSEQEVRVAVISTTAKQGNSCQDPVNIELSKPLGDRPIIDEFSGEAVPAPN